MLFTVFNENTGLVSRYGQAPVSMVNDQAQDGEVAIVGEFLPDEWYWDGFQVQPMPSRPSPDHVWNPSTLAWEAPLATLKATKVVALRKEREKRIAGGFVWDGSTFDSDTEVSQPRLLGAFTTMIAGGWPSEGMAWRLQGNDWRVLSATDVASVWSALQGHVSGIFAKFQEKETEVNAMTDAADVLAYDVTVDW